MRGFLSGVLCSLLFSPFLVFGRAQEPQRDPGKPEPVIVRFYRDFNFVIAFSSNAERVELAKYLDGKGLPEKFQRNPRLARVFTLMTRIGTQIVEEDPKMVLWAARSTGHVYYSGITEIKKIQPEGDAVKVEVTVYHLEPEANRELIARYEAAGEEPGKIPTGEEMLGIVKPAPYKSEEVHTWVQADGRWKKDAANLVFVK
jgi:hypothetical protein